MRKTIEALGGEHMEDGQRLAVAGKRSQGTESSESSESFAHRRAGISTPDAGEDLPQQVPATSAPRDG